MSTDFSYTYLVDSRSIDLFQQCRPSALLGFLQEAATKASLSLNVSREEMIERHHAFLRGALDWKSSHRTYMILTETFTALHVEALRRMPEHLPARPDIE